MAKFSANWGFIGSKQGILKLLQTGLNVACVTTIALAIDQLYLFTRIRLLFYFVSVTFLISTTLDLLSCCLSKPTAQNAIVSSHEVVVNLVASALYLSAGIAILVETCSGGWCSTKYSYLSQGVPLLIAAGSLAIPNSILYCASTVIAIKTN